MSFRSPGAPTRAGPTGSSPRGCGPAGCACRRGRGSSRGRIRRHPAGRSSDGSSSRTGSS
ncbi:hypothetical protein [Salinibacterium sp. dk5596]|uniref:hypothetical protein n=1 Tax=unclassified Salinibacterium TaxID=2632331 RepID=UPI003519FD2E